MSQTTTNTITNGAKDDAYKVTDADGHFRRKPSTFRNSISPDPNAEFPAEKDRYVLYINRGCPWAHRANIVRSLKGLQDVIQLVKIGNKLTTEGWIYDGSEGTDPVDPLYGFTKHSQLYFKADPNYTGRFTVPTLWDKKRETIVNNESSEIIRMLYTSFDSLVEPSLRESAKPLYPPQHRARIDAMNEWVYDMLNNGVYKTGFAATQEAYDENVYRVFEALDRVEKHFSEANEGKGTNFLFGDHISEADIRLYTTVVRFDVGYYTLFNCNLRTIRDGYPRIHKWLRTLYWDESRETNGGAFRQTTDFKSIKEGYAYAKKSNIIPAGPVPDILPLD